MNGIEMLRRCARFVPGVVEEDNPGVSQFGIIERTPEGSGYLTLWNPLNNPHQALELAIIKQAKIFFGELEVTAECDGYHYHTVAYNGSPADAFCRAIVTAVAMLD
jgi:hypothetical protein